MLSNNGIWRHKGMWVFGYVVDERQIKETNDDTSNFTMTETKHLYISLSAVDKWQYDNMIKKGNTYIGTFQ